MEQAIKVRLKEKYHAEVVPLLREKLGLKNAMQVPRLVKIALNIGMGEATQNGKLVDEAVDTLTRITGQKAVPTRSRTAISNFKLKINQAIGARVTLHGDKMWEFLDRLVSLALPRVKDFRGIAVKGFDGRGNYTLGLKEQIVFLEVDYDRITKVKGMDISFVTTAKDDAGCRELLTALGMPFRK